MPRAKSVSELKREDEAKRFFDEWEYYEVHAKDSS